jgi:hypothetical protein
LRSTRDIEPAAAFLSEKELLQLRSENSEANAVVAMNLTL